MTLRSRIKRLTPWPLHYLYRKIYYFPQDFPAAMGFLFHATKSPTTFGERFRLVKKFYAISYYVDLTHTLKTELITIARKILDLGPHVPGAIARPAHSMEAARQSSAWLRNSQSGIFMFSTLLKACQRTPRRMARASTGVSITSRRQPRRWP